MLPKLYIVVPCYNEQEVLPLTSQIFIKKLEELTDLGEISSESRVLFVNDGSRDTTWEIIEELADSYKWVEGISLSRNRGHQNALLAGLMYAKEKCDITVSIDADGQDDINAMDAMVDAYHDGCEIVYGVRSSRDTDTFFKRTTARTFYKIMRAMGVETVYDHADYRLMSRRALNGLAEFKEVNLFLRGMVPLVGYKSTTVTYERGVRFAGESKYPLKKMLAFAFEGITSLSVKPIRIITTLGIAIFGARLVMLVYSLIRHFCGYTVDGWTSLAVSIWALGGIQLLAIGVIGEYVGKIYLESKHRPTFIVAEYLNDENKKD